METLSAALNEDSDTVMDVWEPYLLQLGFLNRTPRGRVATRLAHEHLGRPFISPPHSTSQSWMVSECLQTDALLY